MKAVRYVPVVLLLSAAFPLNSVAERNTGYFEVHSGGAAVVPQKDGFFFYKDPKEIAPEEAPPVDPNITMPEPPKTQEQARKPEKKAFEGQVPWDKVYSMHPKEFKVLLEDTLDYAIQDPQPDRVQAYMTLQYVAIDRSEKFQQTWADVLNVAPVLDPTVQRPPTATGTRLAVEARNADIAQYISEMRENMGILLFTRADCSFCAEQKNILASFSGEWRWGNIQEIDILRNPEQAAHYGVTLVPDMYVVGNVGGEILQKRLRAGVSTKMEIERGMLEAYSKWFLGRSYMPEMEAQGKSEFSKHIDRLAQESRKQEEKQPKSGQHAGGLDAYVKKYQEKKSR